MGLFSPTSRNRIRLRLAPYDVICALAAPFAALAMRDPKLLTLGDWSDGPTPPYIFAAAAVVAALVSFLAFRLSDGMSRFFSVHDVISVSGAVTTTVAATSVALFTFTRLDGIPRSTPLIYAFVLGGSLILGRAFHRVLATEREKGFSAEKPDQLRNVVIIGANRFSALATKLIGSQIPATTRVVAFLDDRSEMVGRAINGVRIVGASQELESVLDEYELHGVQIDQVLIADGAAPLSDEAIEELAGVCDAHGIDLQTLGEAFNLKPKSVAAAQAAAGEAQPALELSGYFVFKRFIDVIASIALLIVLAPITLIVSGLVLVDVGSPILFWQERIGRGGRRFLLYKFRTYKAPYDWRGEPVAAEDRVSTIGHIVRRTRLDEIPQLLNILVGDMSLIGPRPLLPKDQPDDPTTRLLARPGITGWAQVNGGNLVTPEEKEALDAWYIQHASLPVDLKIVAHSAIIALTGERFDRKAVAAALKWRAAPDAAAQPGDAGKTGEVS
jgi:lipopolysaccharide/colanic/teichoic acid biosynthesis glycosyltransferase